MYKTAGKRAKHTPTFSRHKSDKSFVYRQSEKFLSVERNRTGIKLHVGNLEYRVIESDLEERFQQVGKVEACRIARENFTHKSRGYGIVVVATKEAAAKAIAAFHGYMFLGRRMIVHEYKPPAKKVPQKTTQAAHSQVSQEPAAPNLPPEKQELAEPNPKTNDLK